jgi:hypothetical protein
MAKPRKAKPTAELRARIDQGVYTQLQMHLYDPVNGRIQHGALGAVMEKLTKLFLDRVQQQGLDATLAQLGIDPTELFPNRR